MRDTVLSVAVSLCIVGCASPPFDSPVSSPTAPTPIVVASGNSLSFVSESGEFVGNGRSLTFNQENAGFAASSNLFSERERQVSIGVRQNDGTATWILTLAAPAGERLVRGIYEHVAQYPRVQPGQPGLNFRTSERSCHDNVFGRFEVRDIQFGTAGEILGIIATFEQRCSDLGPALRGSVVYIAP